MNKWTILNVFCGSSLLAIADGNQLLHRKRLAAHTRRRKRSTNAVSAFGSASEGAFPAALLAIMHNSLLSNIEHVLSFPLRRSSRFVNRKRSCSTEFAAARDIHIINSRRSFGVHKSESTLFKNEKIFSLKLSFVAAERPSDIIVGGRSTLLGSTQTLRRTKSRRTHTRGERERASERTWERAESEAAIVAGLESLRLNEHLSSAELMRSTILWYRFPPLFLFFVHLSHAKEVWYNTD